MTNKELEDNQSDDENIAQTEEAITETELEDEQDAEDDTITLTKAELEERERTIRKDQDKRWKERTKALKTSEGGSQNSTQEDGIATKEELDRYRLETKGVEDVSAQDFVLKYAKLEGISVADALKDDVVQAKLSKLTANADKIRATNGPNNRTGRPREKTPEELARAMEKGQMPATKEERKVARAYLQNKYGRT